MSMKEYWERMAERSLEALERIAEAEAQFGTDDYEDLSIISFSYQFAFGGTIYDYAAIKCHGLWYSTGPRAPKAYTWDELVNWWQDSKCDINLHYVTELTQV